MKVRWEWVQLGAVLCNEVGLVAEVWVQKVWVAMWWL